MCLLWLISLLESEGHREENRMATRSTEDTCMGTLVNYVLYVANFQYWAWTEEREVKSGDKGVGYSFRDPQVILRYYFLII